MTSATDSALNLATMCATHIRPIIRPRPSLLVRGVLKLNLVDVLQLNKVEVLGLSPKS